MLAANWWRMLCALCMVCEHDNTACMCPTGDMAAVAQAVCVPSQWHQDSGAVMRDLQAQRALFEHWRQRECPLCLDTQPSLHSCVSSLKTGQVIRKACTIMLKDYFTASVPHI